MTDDMILEKLNSALKTYETGELMLTRDLLLQVADNIDEYVALQAMWKIFLENMEIKERR